MDCRFFITILIMASVAQAETLVDLDDNITSQCVSFSNEVTQQQLDAFQPMLSQRSHRLWHLFFHGLRAVWSGLSLSDQELLAGIHPSLVPAYPQQRGEVLASVDFLYLHRTMILMVREKLLAAGLPCIASWAEPPPISDPIWPVPPLWRGVTNPLILFGKTSLGYSSMVAMSQDKFHNDSWLKGVTFPEMATELENSIHGLFHGRFSARPTATVRPYLNLSQPPQSIYNAAGYEYLIDTYGTMNNKHFWKAHGYLNEVIDRWLIANGYTSIGVDCDVRQGCYQWDTTWVGPDPEEICGCEEHEEGEDHEHGHEDDIYDLITDYAAIHPETKNRLNYLLRLIDYHSAPAGNR